MVLIKSNDHWAFLEEIEAPMWVDLTIEGKSNNQNIDDKWFCTHHPVHQSSSHDLKSALSQLIEDRRTSSFEISVSSSLNLPNSVSRTRGRDFDDKKREGSCQGFAVDKHIVGEKLSSGSATKLKPKLSFTDSKGISSSNPSLVSYANCLTENSRLNVSVTGSSSEGKEPPDSRTSSTIITGMGHQQQHKPMEVTSQPLSMSSRLLSDMRRSLRKSCTTRQVSRLEVNNCQRQSSGRNSSSSNSSTCSSLNPGLGAQSITSTSEQHLKSSLGVRSFSRMTQAAMNKSKVASVFSSTLKIQVKDTSSSSRRVNKFYAKPAHLEASKPKILRPKASILQQRDLQNTCLKPKKKEGLDGTGRCKTVVPGKENAIRRIAVSQKCNGRDPSTFNMVKDQKRTQHKVTQRLAGRSVVSSKQQAKSCPPSEAKSLENGSKRVYFR